MHADRPQVAADWATAISDGQIVLSPVVMLELLQSARSGQDYDELLEELSTLRVVAVSPGMVSAAVQALRDLAYQGQKLHRLPIQDALIAAAAQERGYGVLHYDGHYDRLATVMNFESRWIAPAGTLCA